MTLFYAVSKGPAPEKHPSDQSQSDTNPEERLFETKEDALKCLKSLKKSRLKVFSSREQALEFAASRPDEACQNGQPEDQSVKGQPPEGPNNGERLKDKPAPTPSEGCLFKSLTPQELKMLKVLSFVGYYAVADEQQPTSFFIHSRRPSRKVTRTNVVN